MTAANWITLAIAAMTLLGTFVTVRVQRRRLEYEAPEKLTRTALSLIAPLEARIDTLETELHGMERELEIQKKMRYQLQGRVEMLEEWIRSQGFDPEQIA